MDYHDLAILLTYMNRDEPYNDAELLVVNQAAKNIGVKMPYAFNSRVKWILTENNK